MPKIRMDICFVCFAHVPRGSKAQEGDGHLFFVHCYVPSYAPCKVARSNFFIGKKACVIRSICSRVPFFIISPIAVGQICQESPNLSLSQPHCSALGSAESFSQ